MDPKHLAKRNARLALFGYLFNSLAFILPVWLLYSVNTLGLSTTIATASFMCIWLTAGLLEIPTGALADRWGRKKVFILGNALLALYPLAYAFGLPVGFLIFFGLVSGLGQALQSGALLPLVHKSYENAGFSKKAYNNFLSNSYIVTFGARALSGVTGAALYAIDPKLPFIAMFLVTLCNCIVGFLLHPEPVEQVATTNRAHIAKTLQLLRRSDIIFTLFVSCIMLNFMAETIWTGYSLFFEADGRSALVIGVLFSVIATMSAIGSYSVRHLFVKLHPTRIMLVFGLGVLATATLIYQPSLTLRLLAILPMGFVSGISYPTLQATIQQEIANRYHSTSLSVANFTQYVTYGLGSVLVGVLFDIYGIAQTRQILWGMTGIVFVIVLLYIHSQRSKVRSFRIDMEAKAD